MHDDPHDDTARLEATLRESEARQAFLLKLSDALRTWPNEQSIKQQTVRMLADHLRLDRCWISEVFEQQGVSTVGPEHLRPDLPPMSGVFRLSDYGETMRQLATRPMVVQDASNDPRFPKSERALLAGLHLRALLVVPLREGQHHVVWALAAAMATPRDWTDGERVLLEEVAERTWAAVERARAEAALRESEDQYRTLFETMGQGYCDLELVRDADGRVVDQHYLRLNPAFERIFGIPVAQAEGRRASEVFPDLEPWWNERLDGIVRIGTPERIEHEIAAFGRWYEVQAYPRGGDRLSVLYEEITARKHAEAVLRESEARATALVATLPGSAAFIVDHELRYLLAEGEALREAGLTPEQLVGRTLEEALGPAVAAEYEPGYRQVLGGGTFEAEHPAHGRAFLTRGTPLRDATGRVTAALFISVDVTARKATETALRESEARHAFLLDLSDALRSLGEPSDITATATRLLGERLEASRAYYVDWPPGEDYGEVSRDYAAPGLPSLAGRYPIDVFRSAYTRLAEGGTWIVDDAASASELDAAERDYYLGAGVAAWVDVPLVKGGELQAALCLVQAQPRRWTPTEIALARETAERCRAAIERARAEAALRESEERFRLFGEASSDVLWVREAERLRWEYLSPAFETIYGYPRTEVMGPDDLRHWADLIVPEDRERALAAIQRVREGEHVTFEYRVRRADGEVRWLRNTDFPIRDAGGRVWRIGGIGQDVTEEKRADAALRELNETLEQRVEERTRELVRADRARRQVLRQLVTAEEDERRRISRELHDSLGQLVTGLLLGLKTLPRGADGQTARIEDLEGLADRIAREMQHLAVELRPPALDNLGLKLALQAQVEEWSQRYGIEGDFQSVGVDGERFAAEVETTLYRVVQEGLNNVVKHAGATRVSLVLERRQGMVGTILEDDGRGFDVEATLASPEKARRLGLRGMRERVALLGGELEIESAEGAGTTLYVRIPLRGEAEEITRGLANGTAPLPSKEGGPLGFRCPRQDSNLRPRL